MRRLLPSYSRNPSQPVCPSNSKKPPQSQRKVPPPTATHHCRILPKRVAQVGASAQGEKEETDYVKGLSGSEVQR